MQCQGILANRRTSGKQGGVSELPMSFAEFIHFLTAVAVGAARFQLQLHTGLEGLSSRLLISMLGLGFSGSLYYYPYRIVWQREAARGFFFCH